MSACYIFYSFFETLLFFVFSSSSSARLFVLETTHVIMLPLCILHLIFEWSGNGASGVLSQTCHLLRDMLVTYAFTTTTRQLLLLLPHDNGRGADGITVPRLQHFVETMATSTPLDAATELPVHLRLCIHINDDRDDDLDHLDYYLDESAPPSDDDEATIGGR